MSLALLSARVNTALPASSFAVTLLIDRAGTPGGSSGSPVPPSLSVMVCGALVVQQRRVLRIAQRYGELLDCFRVAVVEYGDRYGSCGVAGREVEVSGIGIVVLTGGRGPVFPVRCDADGGIVMRVSGSR